MGFFAKFTSGAGGETAGGEWLGVMEAVGTVPAGADGSWQVLAGSGKFWQVLASSGGFPWFHGLQGKTWSGVGHEGRGWAGGRQGSSGR